MPSPAADQQRAQRGITTLLVADLAAAWALLDPARMNATFPAWSAAVAALVYRYGLISGAVAARYFNRQRAAAGLAPIAVPPATPAGLQQVQVGLGWATRGLTPPPADPRPAVAAAETLSEGVAKKLVVDAGRDTVLAASRADRRCRGWAREAEPGACAFCAMLSTRGPVYRSEATSDFQAHDSCHCLPVPLWTDRYTPPAHVRDWQARWAATTTGLSGGDALNAFRRDLERP